MTRFKPVPISPNCVSSRADPTDREHYIAPFAASDPQAALDRLRSLIEGQPRAEIVDTAEGYLHAVFRTRIIRYRDDLELEIDPDAGVVHVRSASRIGYSDMGANRKRVEHLRELFAS